MFLQVKGVMVLSYQKSFLVVCKQQQQQEEGPGKRSVEQSVERVERFLGVERERERSKDELTKSDVKSRSANPNSNPHTTQCSVVVNPFHSFFFCLFKHFTPFLNSKNSKKKKKKKLKIDKRTESLNTKRGKGITNNRSPTPPPTSMMQWMPARSLSLEDL